MPAHVFRAQRSVPLADDFGQTADVVFREAMDKVRAKFAADNGSLRVSVREWTEPDYFAPTGAERVAIAEITVVEAD